MVDENLFSCQGNNFFVDSMQNYGRDSQLKKIFGPKKFCGWAKVYGEP